MRFFRSLLARYILIIVFALFLIQFAYLLIAIFMSSFANEIGESRTEVGKASEREIQQQWHKAASMIQSDEQAEIEQLFAEWQKIYPDSSMFWVDEHGVLLSQYNVKKQYPQNWNTSYTVKFMKSGYGGDPYTVVAFIGANEDRGFVVIELPRALFNPPLIQLYDNYGYLLLIGVVIVVFVFILVSLLFFRGIRKRLLQLQEAMTIRDVDTLPIPIDVKRHDEIGQLEEAFNQMVAELKESDEHQQREEQLRRELIANLSHDLRTPLTKIRAQAYTLNKEVSSVDAQHALSLLEHSIVHVDRLMENLVSYTLLMASKYELQLREVDVIRYTRECVASWYSVFEKEGFEIDVNLTSFQQPKWNIDPIWWSRVIDNILQNVLRHAKEGCFVSVSSVSTEEFDAIRISDRGFGISHVSNEKGAGIGLSIVDMMVKGMSLHWEIQSTELGTTIILQRLKHITS